MRYIFLATGIFMIGLLIWASVRLGFFKDVTMSEQEQPEMHLVYLEHIGPYHKILDSIEKVEAWAQKNSVDCSKSFGHFLDDPDVVEHERLKSHVGCVVDHQYLDLPTDMKYKAIPKGQYLIAEFMGSPAIGPLKVYRKAKQRILDRGQTPPEDILEIYHRLDEKSMKTIFLFRIQP